LRIRGIGFALGSGPQPVKTPVPRVYPRALACKLAGVWDPRQLLVGIEEIMMIINHVTEGMISDHVIGGQNIIRFIIRFNYTYLGKVGNVANFVSVHSGVPSQ
jgi:hypothetical protein